MKISNTHYDKQALPSKLSGKELAKINQSSALTKESDAQIEALKSQPKPARLLDLKA